MEFPGVLEKQRVGILEVNYRRSGISRDVQGKIMLNFDGSWIFYLEIPKECHTILQNFLE